MAGIDGMRQRTMGALATLTRKQATVLALSDVPPSYDAYQEFVGGEEDLFASRFERAITRYLRAAALDSSYAAPLVRAVYAYFNIGDYVSADSLARSLASGTRKLSEYERRYLDRVVAWIEGDYKAAYRAAQQLKAAAPSSSFAQYIAARSAIPINQLHEAARELEKLWPNKYPEMEYYGDLAGVYHLLGDQKRHERVLLKAREVVSDDPRMLAHWARLYIARGELAEVDRVLQEIRANHNPPSFDAAVAMETVVSELAYHGHAAEARAARSGLLDWLRRRPVGEARPSALFLNLSRLGQCLEALRIADSAYAAGPRNVPMFGSRGTAAALCAHPAVADSMSRALATIETPYVRGAHSFQRARIAAALGKKAEAVDLLIDAIAQGQTYGGHFHQIADFATLRDFEPFKTLMRPKD